MQVTTEDVERFQEDGAILLEDVVSDLWIEKIRAGIQKNLDDPSKYSERLVLQEGQGAYFNDYCNWQKIPEFREFVFESGVGKLAADLMKSSYSVFYHEHVLNKEPGTTKSTPWHHDQSYYPIDGWNMISIWIPVDPVPLHSTLKFVKGSHKWDWFYPRKFASETNYPLETVNNNFNRVYRDVPVQEIDSGKFEILSWGCQPGDAVAFHGKMLHGAAGNSSETDHRRVLSVRWTGEGTVLASRPWKVSPPFLGSLKPGDVFHDDIFPLVYGNI